MTLGKREIRDRYDEIAPRFDRLEAPLEWLGVRRLRRSLLSRARGRVLEVAAGTGRNFVHYPRGCGVTAVDLSGGMLDQARTAAGDADVRARLLRADTERLPFRDDAFDTVVDALTLCTYPAPVVALGEMARVCRPDGALLLLEHGRSDHGWLAWLQDRGAERHYRSFGCRWDREPLRLVGDAGLRVESADRSFFGVFHRIVARTGAPREDAVGGEGG